MHLASDSEDRQYVRAYATGVRATRIVTIVQPTCCACCFIACMPGERGDAAGRARAVCAGTVERDWRCSALGTSNTGCGDI